MDVERLRAAEPVLVPDAVHQVLAGDDLAGVADELGEQVELLAGELELLVVEGGPAGGEVDVEAADGDRLLRRGRLGGLHAAQDGAHAGDHLGPAERLDDVVVGAELEPDDAVGLGPAGGEDDDRDAAAGADRAADVAAVAVGQVEVEQDQVGLELLLQLQRAGGRGGDVRLEPLALERLGERGGDRLLVLDEQDPGAIAHAGQHRGVRTGFP